MIDAMPHIAYWLLLHETQYVDWRCRLADYRFRVYLLNGKAEYLRTANAVSRALVKQYITSR